MRARKMLRHASYFHKNPHYIGYDLFDDATEELNKKPSGNKLTKLVSDQKNILDSTYSISKKLIFMLNFNGLL